MPRGSWHSWGMDQDITPSLRIVTGDGSTSPEIVPLLEMLLEDAKQGKLDAVAVVCLCPKSRFSTHLANDNERVRCHEFLWLVEVLRERLIAYVRARNPEL